MRFFPPLALFALLLLSAPDLHAQQTGKIADFAGPWVGRSEPGSDRQRAATVLIEPGAGDAFDITWASFEADPPGSGNVVARERKLRFRPSKVPGIWLAPAGDDPFETLAAWAAIQDRSLVVSTAALHSDGRLERHSYRRTLTKDGLALSYKRWLDQDLDREIDAEFLKITTPMNTKP